MTTRRKFILSSTAASVATMLGMPTLSFADDVIEKADKPLRILFLGGTGFLGPHTVKHAIARGHQVTLFNRDRSKENLFPELESIIGNRDPKIGDGLSGLKGKRWDCVIDTSGYIPRIVEASSKLLADYSDQYLFISSISVYADFKTAGQDETAEVGTLEDINVEKIDGKTYGPLKAYCEKAAENNFKNRTTIIRPGLIVGPRDRTDRFTYWPVRIAKGGEILAPGDGKDFVQYIDVRDLGAFIINCLETKAMGTFNATSPIYNETTADMLNYCRDVINKDADFTWADTEFLNTHDVKSWSDMPVWVPRQGENSGLSQINSEKAEKIGLDMRAREDTIRDTLTWFVDQPKGRQNSLRAGISKEREASILNAWHAPTNS